MKNSVLQTVILP